jgi:glyoxylase-like metal-dependent hydrolase (beta-lactamase superfamily II)
MTSRTPHLGCLQWDVLTVTRPGLTRDLPPGKEDLAWVANSSTLIHGARDAVLVDTFLTIEQSRTLVDWVTASGKNLISIYVTHGHGDHFFGLAALLERFPEARAVATPEVVGAMRSQSTEAWQKDFWRRLFPAQIPEHLLIADALESCTLNLEGRRLDVVDTGRTDTAHSTVLHVPSIGLIVGGDVVYNGIPLSRRDRYRKQARMDCCAGRAGCLEPAGGDRRPQGAGEQGRPENHCRDAAVSARFQSPRRGHIQRTRTL